MRIPARATIAACEASLEEMNHALGAVPLDLPTNAQYLAAGGEAALIQLLLTWSQRDHRPLLNTYASSESDPQLEKIVGSLHGLVAATVCRSARGRVRSVDITDRLKSLAEARLRSSYDRTHLGREGRSVSALCVDQTYPFPASLYKTEPDGTRSLNTLEDFDALAKNMFSEIILPGQYTSIPDKIMDATGAFLLELVSNTHDHATKDYRGEADISPSVRGLQFKFHSAVGATWKSITEGYDPLGRYFHSLSEHRDNNIQLVEISVFDSGSGLAQNWLKKPLSEMTYQEEFKAVIECFGKGNSTKRHRRFGLGLPLVIRLLKERQGFIRLRTGRLSLYANFIEKDDVNIDYFTDFDAWTLRDNEPLASVSGTLVTVLLPVR